MEEDKDQIKSMEVELEVQDNPTENPLYKKGEKTEKTEKKRKKRRGRDRANTAISYTDIKLSYCSHVGWDGTLVLISLLALAGLSLYLVYAYSAHFANFDRDGLFVYLILTILYVLLRSSICCFRTSVCCR